MEGESKRVNKYELFKLIKKSNRKLGPKRVKEPELVVGDGIPSQEYKNRVSEITYKDSKSIGVRKALKGLLKEEVE